MPELTLADGTTVEVVPPTVPALEMGPPAPAGVVVVPVAGPPGPQGAPGDAAGQLRMVGAANGALSGHRLVTPAPDGSLGYASNDEPNHLNAPLWLTLGAAVDGDTAHVLVYGSLDEPSWSWTPGPLYLGVEGFLTQTPPSAPDAVFLTQVGFATAPTTAFIDPHPPITLGE
jgi:hypothetical protein